MARGGSFIYLCTSYKKKIVVPLAACPPAPVRLSRLKEMPTHTVSRASWVPFFHEFLRCTEVFVISFPPNKRRNVFIPCFPFFETSSSEKGKEVESKMIEDVSQVRV